MSREQILKALRNAKPLPDPGLPSPDELATYGLQFDDPATQFAEVLAKVGGELLHVQSPAAAREALEKIAAAQQPAFALDATLQAEGIPFLEPHTQQPQPLGVAAARGALGVAENAAVWVAGDADAYRAQLLLPEHLVLVIEREQLVATMHQAYARLPVGRAPYGVFLSGPSKTADIEQSLVIGAQGPRRLTVIMIGAA